MSSTTPNIRQALHLDAIASGTMGAMLVVAAVPAERLLGLPLNLLRIVGLALLPFAVLLLWIASRPVPPRGLVMAVVLVNVAWVVASLALVLSGAFAPSPLGIAFVLAQAAAVALFSVLEFRALRGATASEASRPATSEA